jgi:hypothetical protein
MTVDSVAKKAVVRRRRSIMFPASQEGRGVPDRNPAFAMKSRRSAKEDGQRSACEGTAGGSLRVRAHPRDHLLPRLSCSFE